MKSNLHVVPEEDICLIRYRLFYGKDKVIEWSDQIAFDHEELADRLEAMVVSLRAEKFPIKRPDVI